MYLSKHQIAIMAIIANTIIWSAASPIFKWSLVDSLPFTFTFYRFVVSTLIMLPLVINKIKISSEDVFKIFTLSLVGVTANIVFYYLGLTLAPSINVPIIGATTPLFLILGAFIFLHEKPTKKLFIGTFISLIGVLVIVITPIATHESFGSLLGNIYYLLAVLALVIYTILFKKYKLKYHYSTLIFWMFFMGAITLFPLYLFELLQTGFNQSFNVRSIIGILYGGLFSSTLGYLFYNYGAKHIKAEEIGIFTLIEPIATALVAIPLLGEKITFTYLLGSVIVFLGIFVAEVRLHYHPFHHFYKNLKTDPLANSQSSVKKDDA